MFSNFSENRTVYEIVSKNVVEPEGLQMTSQYGTYPLHAGLERRYILIRTHMPTPPDTHMHARKHTHKYVILIAFTTATMVSRTRLIVTLYVHCILLLLFRA
jgi:hypothetical protein